MTNNSMRSLCFALLLCSLLLFCLPSSSVDAQEPLAGDDVRRSATVDAIEKAQPSVAAVYAYGKKGRSSGSGSVIDPRGYILTAKHVIADQHIVLLGGRPPLRASVVGTMPEFDVAIIRLGEKAFNRPASPVYPRVSLPPDYVRLGVDSDVRMGETVLNIGSPGGRGIVATRGIVSAVAFTGVNPLSLATQSSTAFDEMLQFDAPSNPGNSGGPLVNLLGQQVGLVVGGIHSEQGIHFALPLKTIRYCIPQILNSEMRHRFVSGLTVDPQLAQVVVTDIAKDSQASTVGIQVGDQIVSVNGRALRDPIDWEFTRFDWRPGDEIQLGIERDAELIGVTLTLANRTGVSGVEADDVEPGLLVRHAAYDSRLPNPISDADRPAGPQSVIEEVVAKPENVEQNDHYELVIEGLLKINKAGRYRLGIRSDDGSKLFFYDELLVDNGGNHGPILRTGWADLQPGFHPFRIEYYEDEGEQMLDFLMAEGDNDLEPVPAKWLFHRASNDSSAK